MADIEPSCITHLRPPSSPATVETSGIVVESRPHRRFAVATLAVDLLAADSTVAVDAGNR
jgi:hypothetical protein